MAKLTPQQLEAVQHDGHLLIVAGPGSGKTSTSVAKAKRVLRDGARSMLMVTFTRDAAEEMRKRLAKAIQTAGGQVPGEDRLIVATFHSIAIRHLKRHGLTQRVLSPASQDHLYRDAASACGVDKENWGDVQKEFEKLMYSLDPSAADVTELTRRVHARYGKLLHATGQVDLYTVMRDCALKSHDGTLPALPFTDILVDEGQDTDELQKMWIFAHARAGRVVTIVGDDDQSIYEFRNALGYEGMRSFLETFRARRIELGDNFRCRSEVLGPASVLVSHNEKRLEKHLVARRGPGGKLAAYRAASQDDQNATLAGLIAALPEKHRNTAVLARTNRSLDMLEIELRGKGISYSRIGKSIWEQPVIAGYLGLLQSLLDGTPAGLLPVLQLREIDGQLRAELLASVQADEGAFLDGEVPALGSMTALDKAHLSELAKDCAYWRKQLRHSGSSLGGSVKEVVLEVGSKYASWTRGDHGKKLLDICSRVLAGLNGPLSGRLKLVTRKERNLDAPVVLMTMHGAKGLEFETVHVVDCNKVEDGSTLIHPEAERRLMYVAITRAKNCCLLWCSGPAHPTLHESGAAYCKTGDELRDLVGSSG